MRDRHLHLGTGHARSRSKQRAATAGINVSVTEAPWARLDMAPPHPTAVVRASPHYYNTEGELDRLVDVVAG